MVIGGDPKPLKQQGVEQHHGRVGLQLADNLRNHAVSVGGGPLVYAIDRRRVGKIALIGFRLIDIGRRFPEVLRRCQPALLYGILLIPIPHRVGGFQHLIVLELAE